MGKKGFWVEQETVPNPDTDGRTSIIVHRVICKRCHSVELPFHAIPGTGEAERNFLEATFAAENLTECSTCMTAVNDPEIGEEAAEFAV